MTTVLVRNLKKYFQSYKRESGLRGTLKSFIARKYEEVKAVDDVSFSIKEGELVGFIGPNGAGKTTTLKCLSGLLHPTSGFVSVLDFLPAQRHPKFLKQIALVMGQKRQLWWDLPAEDTFRLNKEIYEIPTDKYQKILNELTKLLEAEDILKIQVKKLSLGQRMKCELIASLLHSPKVLFLDEPTIGLDVVMQKKMRDFIKEYNRRYQATIILTSHYMGDVKELCKRVIIIDKGKILFDGQLEEIIQRYAHEKIISLVLSKEIDPRELEKISRLKEFNYPKAVVLAKRENIPAVCAQLLQKFPVADFNVEEMPIEDIIRKIFTG